MYITDINECIVDTNNCDVNAACINTVGSFLCECNPGFSGDGTSCQGNLLCNFNNHYKC